MTKCSKHPNLPIVENPFGSSNHCHPTPGHEDREAFHCNGTILGADAECDYKPWDDDELKSFDAGKSYTR